MRHLSYPVCICPLPGARIFPSMRLPPTEFPVQHRQRLSRMMSRRRLVAGAAATVVAAGAGTIPAMCRGRIYPGAQFGNVDLGGLIPEEGERTLREELADFEQRALEFVFEDQAWDASLADLGFSLDYASMIQLAMAHGRTDGVTDRYRTFVMHDDDTQVPLILHEDTAQLTTFLEEIAAEIDISPTNARLALFEGQITVEPHADGRELDITGAKQAALLRLREGEQATIGLETTTVAADVRSDDLAGAKEDAWRLVSEPIVFTHADLAYPVGSDHLTSALRIDSSNAASLDPAMLQDRFAQIAGVVATPARNVMLGWDNGLYVVADDEDGAAADLEAMAELALELAASDERLAALPLKPVRAAARADNLDELAIDSHLASGSSSFAGSSAARAENVRVSADNISYKLVAPGETFSFNDLIGPISEEHGYVSGTIIQGDWVASDIGGGVCQVSTTVFRAAANAGFRFSEWHPHSWRLAFYEADGSDPGFDGAIYQANRDWETNLDLRFENVLDSWLLLMMVIDGDTVRAHFYGKDPGWDVEVHPARVSDPIKPGEPVERVNSNLAPGERKLVQQAQPGYLVHKRRVITGADGSVIADGDFVSDYVPQPEAWEVGPT